MIVKPLKYEFNQTVILDGIKGIVIGVRSARTLQTQTCGWDFLKENEYVAFVKCENGTEKEIIFNR